MEIIRILNVDISSPTYGKLIGYVQSEKPDVTLDPITHQTRQYTDDFFQFLRDEIVGGIEKTEDGFGHFPPYIRRYVGSSYGKQLKLRFEQISIDLGNVRCPTASILQFLEIAGRESSPGDTEPAFITILKETIRN